MTPEPALADGIAERIASLPTGPGVYLFKDREGRILYVGKAQNLRSRVRSYFGSGDGRHQVHFLVPRIADLEVVVTASVKDALLLENQLIKKHRPRFNVRLRDDKNYLGLKLAPGERYPRFRETRSFAADGAVYFGPYTSSLSLRETLSELQRIFPLRTCSNGVLESYRRRGRPCLEHAIGRCSAPCCGEIDDPAYRELVDGAVLFLRGRSGTLVRDLRQRMEAAASAERFEEAARLRDRIESIERTVQKQSMVSTRFVDRDALALARAASNVEIQVLHVRRGKLLGGDHYAFRGVHLDDAEVLGSFLGQFYGAGREIPHEVLLSMPVEAAEPLVELWRESAGRSVQLRVAQRGEGRRLVEMAQRNAELALSERTRREHSLERLGAELQKALALPALPRRIECYDVSHLRGSLHVASRVVFQDGQPKRSAYRRYRLRETAPGDDYGAMREVLARRFRRLQEEQAPDLILLDGGKGQLAAVRAVMMDRGITGIELAAIAKERDLDSAQTRVRRDAGTKRERIFRPGIKDPLVLAPDSPAMLLLQRVRDESHRFAIRYHRELRRKTSLRSILDELPGIGPKRRGSLLRTLGSLERVKRATEEELAAVPGLTRANARMIRAFFDAPEPADDPVKGTPPQAD
ncbi:MAG: excinuclease ABC subunit UvrC [Myxococcota bacterium]